MLDVRCLGGCGYNTCCTRLSANQPGWRATVSRAARAGFLNGRARSAVSEQQPPSHRVARAVGADLPRRCEVSSSRQARSHELQAPAAAQSTHTSQLLRVHHLPKQKSISQTRSGERLSENAERGEMVAVGGEK
jgi:hypothetical protein